MALPRSCGAKASSSTACESGCSAPPVAPCMMRKRISEPSVGARPHRNDEAVKPTTDSINNRLRPNMLASQPVIGRMIALATRYDVSAHVASSIDAERLPAMCGSDTFTTVVSSTSMNVANITETAMSQGLICFCSICGSKEFRSLGSDFRIDGHRRPAAARPNRQINPHVLNSSNP